MPINKKSFGAGREGLFIRLQTLKKQRNSDTYQNSCNYGENRKNTDKATAILLLYLSEIDATKSLV